MNLFDVLKALNYLQQIHHATISVSSIILNHFNLRIILVIFVFQTLFAWKLASEEIESIIPRS